MYSSKQNVNTLTALLVAHGIRHAVVCPGSRNAPIVHNLNECPDIACYPVTDERSAGFFALGMAQATDEPVVVCVTSGTALLNLAPAVAEAHYQHQSLIIISADRPAEWIGQLDGQTLLQPGVLAPWVSTTVDLHEAPSIWHCNRLVNEALIEATTDRHPCVHINVHISEPLFQFTTQLLPNERVIHRYTPATDYDCLPQTLVDDLLNARHPLIVFGQLSPHRFHYEGLDQLFSHVIVLHEALAPFTTVSPIDEALSLPPSGEALPDFILYVGDAVVSKRLKHFLRQATSARCWRISLTGEVEDTFQNLQGIVVGDAERILQSLSTKVGKLKWQHAAARADYRRQWLRLLKEALQRIDSEELPFGEYAAVRLFEQQLGATFSPEQLHHHIHVHYANSTAIRLACRYAKGHPVWCNRGVNGIEGSLSTAAGFTAATPSSDVTFIVIGDLSFFYDQNALWNQNLHGSSLRILLLNNRHGAIFDHLPGLSQSSAASRLVAASHTTTAEGICQECNIVRRQATDMQQLLQGIDWLVASSAPRPMLLEVLMPQ